MIYISWSSDFAIYFEDYFDVWTSYFGIMTQYDTTFDLKINIGHCDLYFMGQWFYLISWRPFDIWTPYFGIMSQYVFHGPVILPNILKTILWLNIILWDYESVWPDIWPPNICRSHYDLYFMVHWICPLSWRLFDVWTSYFWIMNQ